jgi:hypothetical protein
MATEEQVLTLTTEFNDQASAAIAGVREAIAQLSGPAVREAQRRVNQEMGEWEKAVRNLGREALGVGRAFGDLVKVIGPFPVAVGLAGYEITRIIRSSAEWSRGVVEMSNAAKMAGLSFGEFKGISEQMQRMGLSARDASAGIAGFNRAYSEVLTSGGKRAEIMSLAGMGYAQNMAQVLLNLRGITDETDRLNAVRHAGENVYQNAVNDTHDTILARYRERQFLAKFNAEFLINIHRDLNKEDVKRMQARDELSTKARELNEAMTEEAQTREEINEKWNEFLAGPELKMIQLLIDIEKNILARMEQTAPAFGVGPAAPARPGQTNTPGPSEWSWGSAFGMGKPASAPSAAPLPPPQGLADQLGLGTLGGPAAGPATGAAKFYGFTDAGDGGGSIAGNWRQSENVEDDRSGQFDQNTNEVRRLNDNLQRILSLTKPGGGGGLAGQLGLGNISSLGGGGGGGGGYRGTGPTGTDGTGPTTPPPPPVTGPTGTPLAAVTGGQPFGINVSPERFSQITGLPPSFMNVSAGQRAYARGISTGMGPGGVGLGGQFVGGKPAVSWPTTAAAGGGGGGLGAATGGPAVKAGPGGAVDPNALFQSYVTKFKGSSLDGFVPKDGSEFGITKGTPEEWARLALATSMQESGLKANAAKGGLNQFDRTARSDDLANYGLRGRDVNDPDAQAQALVNQWTGSIPKDGYVTSPNSRGRLGAGRYFGSLIRDWNGPGIDVLRNKHLTQAEKVAAANAVQATTAQTLVGAPGTGGAQVIETLPSGAQVIRGAATTTQVTGIPSEATQALTHSGTTAIDPVVLAHAAELAKSRDSAAVNDYLKKSGVRTSQFECAEFVTSIIKNSGGKEGVDYPAAYDRASNYLKIGAPINGLVNAQPGDILAKMHEVGGHGHAAMIGPEGYNPATGKVQIIQADSTRMDYVDAKNPGYWGDFRIGRLSKPLDTNPSSHPTADTPTPSTAQTAAGVPTDPFAWPSASAQTTHDSIRQLNAIAYGGDKGIKVPDNSLDKNKNDDDILKGSRWDTGDATADRAALDSRAAAVAAQQHIKLTIKHRNAPADVTAKADGDAFKGHTMERSNAPPPEAPTKFKSGGLEFA